MESKNYSQMSVKERIIIFVDEMRISRSKFEAAVGVSHGYITKLAGDITLSLVKKICVAYPELSREWLAWGEGEMFYDKNTNLSPVARYLVNTGRMSQDIAESADRETNTEAATLKALLEQKENENAFLRTLVQNLTTNISNQVK